MREWIPRLDKGEAKSCFTDVAFLVSVTPHRAGAPCEGPVHLPPYMGELESFVSGSGVELTPALPAA